MHPPSPVNMGEAWTKSVYEALRNSPQWDGVLFLITFDEHGVRRGRFLSSWMQSLMRIGPFGYRAMRTTCHHLWVSLQGII